MATATTSEPADSAGAAGGQLTARDIRYGAAVYGSFLVASVVGAAFEAGADARTLTGSAFVSMLVFWLAHVWSEVVGEHISAGTRFHARVIPVIARREWPLVEAAAVPTALLALAWAGVWSRETGAALALGSAILQIPGWGLSLGFAPAGRCSAPPSSARGRGCLVLPCSSWRA
jgi:hypothetical protein